MGQAFVGGDECLLGGVCCRCGIAHDAVRNVIDLALVRHHQGVERIQAGLTAALCFANQGRFIHAAALYPSLAV